MKLWKTLTLRGGKLRSGNGDQTWEVGTWYKVEGELAMCHNGFHASRNIIDAMTYVAPDAIAEVEVRGEHLGQPDKQCWSEMRIVKAWEWAKGDSVSLAIYAAELVIGMFEKKHPDDKRPRQAIDAAKAWLEDPCKKTWDAARDAARAASDAAWAAASDAVKAKCHRFVVRRLRGKKEMGK